MHKLDAEIIALIDSTYTSECIQDCIAVHTAMCKSVIASFVATV